MPATQTIEFRAAPGLTLTAELFAIGSDAIVATESAIEQTNRNGTYRVAYTDIPAGEYQLIAFSGTTPVASWLVTLTLATATFQVYARATSINMVGEPPTAAANASQVRTELATELGRIDDTISSRSTLTAANVWGHATRSLTTFGTLVSDIWSHGTRTLTAISDSAGITTLLSRIIGTLAAGTHEPQTGDSFARLGAPEGASIAEDIAGIEGGGGETKEDIYDHFTSSGRQNTFRADVSGLATAASIAALNDFNPVTDTVARVTLVDTTTTNTDMRGTNDALTTLGTNAPTDWINTAAIASDARILADTDRLAGSVTAAQKLRDSTETIITVEVLADSTTTTIRCNLSIPTATLAKVKPRTLLFLGDTTTESLQSLPWRICGMEMDDTTVILHVAPLPEAPVAGDKAVLA